MTSDGLYDNLPVFSQMRHK